MNKTTFLARVSLLAVILLRIANVSAAQEVKAAVTEFVNSEWPPVEARMNASIAAAEAAAAAAAEAEAAAAAAAAAEAAASETATDPGTETETETETGSAPESEDTKPE